ncbi:lipocalin family protein [Palleronia caenipelagi]|uniref:Outer membrane lipoprotein Blc n=2 Tax=Palleronia caenipelagi TaxID=2489174 RepID=A0A547QAE3_9RHOB|nr:lipocalin family protein [Palleronia caenipelagi]
MGLTIATFLAGCSTENPLIPATSYRDQNVPIGSRADFDPERYLGRWYEIASYPVSFQDGCTDTQAIYGAAENGITVRNTCLRDGERSGIEGRAELVGPGRLKVQLGNLPFTAPYWVLWVDETYQTAVVGVPSGRAGWILARDPDISEARLAEARDALERNGYDLTALRMTPQSGG